MRCDNSQAYDKATHSDCQITVCDNFEFELKAFFIDAFPIFSNTIPRGTLPSQITPGHSCHLENKGKVRTVDSAVQPQATADLTCLAEDDQVNSHAEKTHLHWVDGKDLPRIFDGIYLWA